MRLFSVFVFTLFVSFFIGKAAAQSELDSANVSTNILLDLPDEPIEFQPEAASAYIQGLLKNEALWRAKGDSLQVALRKLIHHFSEPFDSVGKRLKQFRYDSVRIDSALLVYFDSIPLKWLNRNSFILDTVPLEKNLFIKQKTIVYRLIDSLSLAKMNSRKDPLIVNDSLAMSDSIKTTDSLEVFEYKEKLSLHIDSLLKVKDTIIKQFIDFDYLKAKNISVHWLKNGEIVPAIFKEREVDSLYFAADSSKLFYKKSSHALEANEESPFYIVPNFKMPDSLKIAVETLLNHTQKRDSILLFVNDIAGKKTPMWLSSVKKDFSRFWVKNSKNDSITVWIGNPTSKNITLTLEEDVNVERLERKKIDDVPFTTVQPERTLVAIKPLKEIPVLWTNLLTSAFTLNQNYLSKYWAKGGESSFSSMLDINAKADYDNKAGKTKWINSGRLSYGNTWTSDNGFRTNTDIVEINSQYNRVIREKIDFSAGLYFKTQIAKGYNYPNDSVPVSKFLNPGTLTLGIGLEYKPDKKTSINFSPLSFRNTFVLDTLNINQTAHGIDPGKRAKNEMGGQLVMKNKFKVLKDMEISNSLRLFSSYLDKPQNIDVDWEMSLEKQISWYFKIRLHFHLIYDDDILFPILGEDDVPIVLPDGTEKLGPRMQFNQLLGLTVSFRIKT